MNDISLGFAFLAGLVSFLSPCVLPVVPGYLSFVTGLTMEELRDADAGAARRHPAFHGALFVLGFSAVFVGFGATATIVGRSLFQALPILQQVGGLLIVGFGLVMLDLVPIPSFLQRDWRLRVGSSRTAGLGSVAVGVAFGAGWTPCIGPILASILLFAGMETTPGRGMTLLSFYSFRLGLPFFVAAVGLNWYLAGVSRLRRWAGPLQRTAGAVLVLIGILLVTGRFSSLAAELARYGQLFYLEM